MGLLSIGTPLEWKDAQKYSDHVRKHGIEVRLSGGASDRTKSLLAILEYLEGCSGERKGCTALG